MQWAACALSLIALLAAAGLAVGCTAQDGTLSSASAATNAAPTAAGWHEHMLEIDGTNRWFRLYRPAQVPEHPPVVVLLHGGTMSMRRLFEAGGGGAQAWPRLADSEGFVLVVPNGTNPANGDTYGDRQNWDDLRADGARRHSKADDVKFIGEVVDWTVKTHHADARRVYVTGVSNGGTMTYRLLVESSERFAAAAVFVATLARDAPKLKTPARPVPLMIANGTGDPIMKWGGGPIPAGGGQQISTPDTLAWWIKANQARSEGVVTEALEDRDPDDGCRIFRTLFPAGPGGAPVLFYRIEGGGHSMPSPEHRERKSRIVKELIGACRDAEGAQLAWDFMKPFSAP